MSQRNIYQPQNPSAMQREGFYNGAKLKARKRSSSRPAVDRELINSLHLPVAEPQKPKKKKNKQKGNNNARGSKSLADLSLQFSAAPERNEDRQLRGNNNQRDVELSNSFSLLSTQSGHPPPSPPLLVNIDPPSSPDIGASSSVDIHNQFTSTNGNEVPPPSYEILFPKDHSRPKPSQGHSDQPKNDQQNNIEYINNHQFPYNFNQQIQYPYFYVNPHGQQSHPMLAYAPPAPYPVNPNFPSQFFMPSYSNVEGFPSISMASIHNMGQPNRPDTNDVRPPSTPSDFSFLDFGFGSTFHRRPNESTDTELNYSGKNIPLNNNTNRENIVAYAEPTNVQSSFAKIASNEPVKSSNSAKGRAIELHKLIKELVNFTGFFTDVETLSKILEVRYDDLLGAIKENGNIFSTIEDSNINKVMVELCPTIKLCEDHLSLKGCGKTECFLLHICREFATGGCIDKNCFYGHLWKSDHNNVILCNLFLDEIPLKVLGTLMEKVFRFANGPKICFKYHQQNCFHSNRCNDLHICFSYATSLGNCSNGTHCPFNHNIREPRCLEILKRFGLSTNKSPREILKIFAENSNDNIKFTVKENIKDTSAYRNQINEIKTHFQQKANSKRTVYAVDFEGNVDTPLICYMGMDNKCAYDDKGCKFLHSKLSYHWQFGLQDDWYNFPSEHIMILETKYRDVTCDEVVLPKLDPRKVYTDYVGLLGLLGNKRLKVDFQNMTVLCAATNTIYSVRHLTTVSSALSDHSKCTVFLWYYKDENGIWTMLGNRHCSTKLIDKSYLENPKGKITFPSSTCKQRFELDFTKMARKTISTSVKWPIKRRPAPFTYV